MKYVYLIMALLQSFMIGHWVTVGGHIYWVVFDLFFVLFFSWIVLKTN